MGFPDVTRADVRGGSIYCEQMDGVTLAVIAERCAADPLNLVHGSANLWERFCHRSKALVTNLKEPELCYLFRAFSKAEWFESQWFCAFIGRLEKRMPYLSLSHITTVLEGSVLHGSGRFYNEKFVEEKLLAHLSELLHGKDDIDMEDLVRVLPVVWGVGNFYLTRLVAEQLAERRVEDLELENQILLLEVIAEVIGADDTKEGIPVCFSIVKDSLLRSLCEIFEGQQGSSGGKNNIHTKYFPPLVKALSGLKADLLYKESPSVVTGNSLSLTALENLLDVQITTRIQQRAFKMTTAGLADCAFRLKELKLSPLLATRATSMKGIDIARFAHICSTDACFSSMKKVFAERVEKMTVKELALMRRGMSTSDTTTTNLELGLEQKLSKFIQTRRLRKLVRVEDRDALKNPIDFGMEAIEDAKKDAKLLALDELGPAEMVLALDREEELLVVKVLEKLLVDKLGKLGPGSNSSSSEASEEIPDSEKILNVEESEEEDLLTALSPLCQNLSSSKDTRFARVVLEKCAELALEKVDESLGRQREAKAAALESKNLVKKKPVFNAASSEGSEEKSTTEIPSEPSLFEVMDFGERRALVGSILHIFEGASNVGESLELVTKLKDSILMDESEELLELFGRRPADAVRLCKTCSNLKGSKITSQEKLRLVEFLKDTLASSEFEDDISRAMNEQLSLLRLVEMGLFLGEKNYDNDQGLSSAFFKALEVKRYDLGASFDRSISSPLLETFGNFHLGDEARM